MDKRDHTALYLVCFSVIPYVWRLGFRNLHKAVFLDLSQREILFVPLQATIHSRRLTRTPISICADAYCDCDPGCCGTAFLRIPFGLGLEADRGKRVG